jgi:hypothetical protein
LNVVYPVDIEDVPQWEKANDMKINVFVLDEEENLKIEYNTIFKNKNVVNLLLHNNHYVWLKNLDRFDASNTSKHTIYRCNQCCESRFATRELLNKHLKKCLNNITTPDEVMPTEGKNTMEFINENHTFLHPFHVIADFESTLETIEEKTEDKTYKYQKHVANSYGLKYNCIHNQYSKELKIYNNENPDNVIESFINELEDLAKYSYKLSTQNKDNIIMTDDEKQKHKTIKNCLNCKCLFNNDNKSVRHHDHITGQYISTLCNDCNLNFQYKKFLPVYIHNLKGYDAHLFITGLNKYGYQCDKENISCIPNNEERYISFSKKIQVDTYKDKKCKQEKPIFYEIRFIDTLGFMATSIESL